jgi:hypothetical protein
MATLFELKKELMGRKRVTVAWKGLVVYAETADSELVYEGSGETAGLSPEDLFADDWEVYEPAPKSTSEIEDLITTKQKKYDELVAAYNMKSLRIPGSTLKEAYSPGTHTAKYNDDLLSSITVKEIEYIQNIDNPAKCECGSDSVGLLTHSSYCPKHKTP